MCVLYHNFIRFINKSTLFIFQVRSFSPNQFRIDSKSYLCDNALTLKKRYKTDPIAKKKCSGNCLRCHYADNCPARKVAKSATITLSNTTKISSSHNKDGIGFAIDVGSTTLAVELYHLRSGSLLASDGAINPQSSISSDIIGRIVAAEKPNGLKTLQKLVLQALDNLISSVCAKAKISPNDLSDGVITGNTIMLHILFGKSPSNLGRAPFKLEWFAGANETLLGHTVWIAPFIGAFVGADLMCALIAANFNNTASNQLLCDIGTNTEVALRAGEKIYAASTAAGPAFESTGIKGSELLDTIASLLTNNTISKTGEIKSEYITLKDGRILKNGDIRAVQTAKAAIAAGISTMLDNAKIPSDELSKIYLAGGFGSNLNPNSAVTIGLIPHAPKAKMISLGNAALTGAALLLLNPHQRENALELAKKIQLVDLGGNDTFYNYFIKALSFSPFK